jgi:hypothetical protein
LTGRTPYFAGLLRQDTDGCLPPQMGEARAAAYLTTRTDNCLTFHRLDG